MANFDSNTWYLLDVASIQGSSFLGTNLFNKGLSGAVFFNTTTESAPRQRWQIFRASNSDSSSNATWALRSGEGGPNAYLVTGTGTNSANKDSNVGNTLPSMRNASIVEEQDILWGITGWGDGTFFLWNEANGTNWHLEEGNGLAFMSNNVNTARDPQRFSFVPLDDKINNGQYSSIVQFSSATSSGSTSATAAPASSSTSPSSSSSSSSSSSTSSPAADSDSSSHTRTIGIAVGVSLGIAILVLLAVLFLLRRAKARKRAREQSYSNVPTHEIGGGEFGGELHAQPYIMEKQGSPAQELHNKTAPAELQSTGEVAELPGSDYDTDRDKKP